VNPPYLGRIAPTPTGYLHLGHAATFWTAFERAREAAGHVILRIEDLDAHRCRPDYTQAAIEDLQWLGIVWAGEPVCQTARREKYLAAWRRLRDGGWIYPCVRTRKDVAASAAAPHEEEPVFPPEWRRDPAESLAFESPAGINWRFRVPDHRKISFQDGNFGPVDKTALQDFGDFVIWNRDNIPAYELAVVVDDARITEVVRGADLLTSTARQILLHEALGQTPPRWFHCPLACDSSGQRLAKRSPGLSIRELRTAGRSPREVVELARSMISAVSETSGNALTGRHILRRGRKYSGNPV
jgi:glutamyl-tRNA synthetase